MLDAHNNNNNNKAAIRQKNTTHTAHNTYTTLISISIVHGEITMNSISIFAQFILNLLLICNNPMCMPFASDDILAFIFIHKRSM